MPELDSKKFFVSPPLSEKHLSTLKHTSASSLDEVTHFPHIDLPLSGFEEVPRRINHTDSLVAKQPLDASASIRFDIVVSFSETFSKSTCLDIFRLELSDDLLTGIFYFNLGEIFADSIRHSTHSDLSYKVFITDFFLQ